MRKILLAVGILVLACASAGAQTTQLNQTGTNANCHVTGCVNVPLSDVELFTFSDTIQHYGSSPIAGKLQFRGMHYQMIGNASGYQDIDLAICQPEVNCVPIANSFAIHEHFAVHCVRSCSNNWVNGYLDVPNEYVASDPSYYGNSGYPSYTCICSGNGQVGFPAQQTNPATVTLVSSMPSVIQVPSEVTVLGGTSFTDFAITATVPDTGIGPVYTVTITATFPDGTTATFPVSVQNLPPPTPPDS